VKVAIVHDWLETWGGAESVLEELLRLYPQADLFALVDFLSPSDRARLGREEIRTTFVQRLPLARRHFRKYLALMPLAVEQLDVRGYEVVISSCHAVSKAVLTGPDQLHLCLCYSPPRYAWDLQHEYLRQSGLDRGMKGWVARRMLHRLRSDDLRASAGVDAFVAISRYIARRIEKCYRRSSTVIYPPVELSPLRSTQGDDYVTVSRLVPYKRVDLLLEAFRALPGKRLHVVGDGPDMAALTRAAPSNVTLHGRLDGRERDALLDCAAAFVYAAEEDFGIAPLEAQSRGVPVIAFARGGTGETIRGLDAPEPTGVLFERQAGEAIAQAIQRFEQERGRISADACRRNAERFAPPRFRAEFTRFLADAWGEFRQRS
jgi:glycosyltransferase involved in cell wall biosynthesis